MAAKLPPDNDEQPSSSSSSSSSSSCCRLQKLKQVVIALLFLTFFAMLSVATLHKSVPRWRHFAMTDNVTSGNVAWASSLVSSLAHSVGLTHRSRNQGQDLHDTSRPPFDVFPQNRDLQNDTFTTAYLRAVENYLLQFRSPYIKEAPVGYSWPQGHDGNGPIITDAKKLIVWHHPPDFIAAEPDSKFFGHCPVSTCSISRSYTKDGASADAVLFHGAGSKSVVERQKPGQVYVFFKMESPVHTSSAYSKTTWNSAFNWTWNYRLDSDIFEPVGYLKRADSVPSLTFFQQLWRNKSRRVAWFSSNCGVQSKRDQYVKRLQKVIPVDIYGRCGTKVCKNTATRRCENLLNDYMFYLSFENSMCEDYVTEKFYKTFLENVHVMPVVRGGANYSQYFPNGTFVDAELFPSPESLGEYLQVLMGEERRYTDMLWRKAHFIYHQHGIIDAWCKLCYKLHHIDKYAKTIPDLYSWLHKDKCRPPRPF